MLCAVDYDGDWDTSNNRIHLSEDYNLIPVVYYATAETETHYYVMYCFYHADDATYENDLEGCLLIIEKEDRLLGMISIAHFDFFSFTNSSIAARISKATSVLLFNSNFQLEQAKLIGLHFLSLFTYKPTNNLHKLLKG